MKMKKVIILFLFLISSLYSMGQGFTYSYADPCTLKTTEIYIDNPNGNTALFYGGQTHSFTSSELQTDAVQQWMNQVNSTNPSGPCSGVALVQNTTLNAIVAQNTISVLSSVMSVLSDLSTMGASSLQGIIQVEESVSSNNNNDNTKQNKNGTTTNNNGGNSTTTNGNTGTSQSGRNQNSSTGAGNGTNTQGGDTTTSNNSTSTGSQSSQSSVTITQQVSTNNPPSNPVMSGNQTGKQTTDNQGNSGVLSTTPVTSGNNTTANTNNPTTPNYNNSTENNQNSPVVSENHESQGQTNVNNTSNNGDISNITGGVNSVKADVTEKNDKEESNNDKVKSLQSLIAMSSSSTKSKVAAVKKGSLMMTGDIVTISSSSGIEPTQIKINASLISSNTKNTFAKGVLVNFTSQVNNSNATFFVSYRRKKFTTIIANSLMLNFEKDFFNTLSLLESYQYKKLTTTVGINLTTGNIGESKFQSISALGGVVYNFKASKKFGMTTMFVMVYSPFVYYYQGIWYQSGLLAVPFVAVDYKITKKFKLNLSFSGINQINDQTLNYQVLIGAKAFL